MPHDSPAGKGDRNRTADFRAYRRRYERTFGPRCDLCGKRAVYRKCKIICTACGYTRDCSDP